MATFTGNDSDNTLPPSGANNSGDDIFYPGRGRDTVNGGTGNDVLVVNYSSNTYAGGNRTPGITSYVYNNGSGYFYAYENDAGDYDQVNFQQIERLNVTGTNFADKLNGGLGDDTFNGGAGNDSINGDAGNDSINGGDGDDTITGGVGANIVNGGAGIDVLTDANFAAATTGLSFNDNGSAQATVTLSDGTSASGIEYFDGLITGSGNDTISFSQDRDNNINTGAGDDIINAGRGKDTVNGGIGNDVLVVNYSSNTYAGGNRTPGITSYVYNNGSGYFYAYENDAGDYDQVNFQQIERLNVTGTNFADKLNGGLGDDTFNGGAGNDSINGDAGNDSINGGDGDDTITGGVGANIVNGGAGIDVLTDANFAAATTGLSFNDNGSAQATVTLSDGTSASGIEYFDGLITGSGNDTISFSKDRDNNINTGAGNDIINAGRGKDTVNGGIGNDVLVVNYSSNTYAGGNRTPGITSYVYNNGSGYFYAYENDAGDYDQVNFQQIERLNVTGTNFADKLNGGLGDDTFNGGAGNDSINGDAGNDSINGGDGDDTITGGVGANIVNGGAGIDVLTDANFAAATTGLSFNDNGSAQATVTLSDGTSASGIEYFDGLITGSGNDTISFSQDRDNNINTGAGDDIINAGRGKDTVNGGIGNDVLVVNYSSNTYAGGNRTPGITSYVYNNGSGYFYAYENDAGDYDQVNFQQIERLNVTGTNFADKLNGGLGDDTFNGGAGNDSINGDAGNDSINGGDGNDTITGGVGANIVNGGAGIDVLTDANFAAATTGLSFNDNGSAQATVTLSDGTSASGIEYFDGLITGSGNDTISFSQDRDNNINTGAGDDIINAGRGKDTVNGGIGNDVLVVNYSSNTYAGGNRTPGITSYVYNNGSGYFYAYENDAGDYDQVNFQQIERLNVTGTNFADNLNGGLGDDTLNGGAGNDSINGGAGNDIITKGAGADKADGGTGIDTLVDADLSADTVGRVLVINGTTLATIVSGSNTYQGFEFFRNITAGSGNDNISFTTSIADNNNVKGGAGNDTIDGGAGNDTIDGGAGNDILRGGIGNDSLSGGTGNDNLSGGTGNDTYVVDSAGDVINETSTLSTEIDTVNSSITYTLGANLENLILTGTAAINGTGNSLNNTLTGNAGNNTLTGNSGNDILNGGSGNDTLIGGTGNDTYVVNNSGDVINETSTLSTEIDTVNSSITYTLGANLENLILTGTAAINGTGNSLNNTLTGNSGNNTLTGNSGNDILIGGSGNDTLIGGTGNDILTGGTGADRFHFDARTEGIDTIKDFSSGSGDIIQISAAGFGGGLAVGTLSSALFISGAGISAPTNGSQRFIYNSTNGYLFFDADGNGSSSATTQIAILSGATALSNSNIVVV
ncbi:hypothetical protein NIES2100_66620 [Calothrix sp. NIES-2100]|uniref:beta strand repeat-containing protein n=1 Tax=Calothrix sp. NIES-2100 TaxID=1954172 RepID=UPI000B5FE286|nr:hypothetical protein NIES2100_66620 [Calothrix sp. NIES-2100]